MIRVLRLLVPLLLAAAATVTVALPAEAATFSASRTSVVSGESVRFSGTVGKQPARKVLLQRKSGTRWVTVTSTTSRSTGAYSFSVRQTGAVGSAKTYRASAPRVGSRAAVTTSARTIRFVAQTATLTAPAKVTTGKSFTATGTFRPIRSGRVVALQQQDGGVWTELARKKQDSQGKAAFAVTLTPTGPASLRVVALASGGAPAKASSSRAVTVLPPALQRMSESAAGVGANSWSRGAAVSPDGRYVAFMSNASNLVAGDTNGFADIFVRDLEAGTIERVSISDSEQQSPFGGEYPSISADGRYVTFESSSPLSTDSPTSTLAIYVRNRVDGTTRRVSQPVAGDATPTNNSYQSSISADGRYVAFASIATNLVPNDTNGKADIFLRDLVANTTERVSTDNDGGEVNGASGFPRISADGSAVAYDSVATDIVDGDTNGVKDVFWWPRSTGSVLRVSQTSAGVEGNAVSYTPSISGDGRYVAFTTRATNLGVNDDSSSDVVRWDSVGMGLALVSVSDTEVPAIFDTGSASISADGQRIAFIAYDALAPGDTNDRDDVYVRDFTTGTTRRASDTHTGTAANDSAAAPALSGDGNAVLFPSLATNMVPEADTNADQDLFFRDLTR